MKGFKPAPLVGLGLIFCALLLESACGGKTPQNGPAALNILTSSPLPTAAEGDLYMQGLVASGGLQPYTWTVDSGALPPGLSLSTNGVLSGTPPSGSGGTSGAPYSFTLRVTDSQKPVAAYQVASMSLTVNPPLSFTASTLNNAVISVAYTATVAATGGVTMTSVCTGYTYALAPSSLPLPAGLTLDPRMGTISGTPTGPIGTFPFTLQVTDCYPTTATANFTITVTGKIQGNYAFSFNGYNSQGQAFYMAGSFVADGNGDITSGVFDRNGNDSTGAMPNVAMTVGTGGSGLCPASGPPTGMGSVYCVGRPAIMGASGANLGTIVIAWTQAGKPYSYSFSVSVSLISDSRIILADPNNPGMWGSGVLKTQGSLSGISLGSGSFGFGLFGIDSGGNRYGGAGYFVTDGNGDITSGNGEADINDNGTVQGQAPLTGNISPTVDPTTGRGTASFTIGSTTFDYAFYAVPAAPGKGLFPTLLAVQTDAISGSSPVTLASIVQRGASGGTSTFTNLNLNATRGNSTNGSVFELNAVSTSGGTAAPDISLGLGNFDGSGNVTSYVFDENKAGTLTTPAQNTYTGTYSVDSTNKQSGRVTVNLTGVTNNPVWYLTASNTGFVVGTDPGVTVGSFEPQTVPQPVTILSIFGNFYGGTSDPVLPSVTNVAEAVLATPPPPPGSGNGTLAGTYDSSGSGIVMMNQMFSYPSQAGSPGGFCIADGDTCPTPQQANSALGRMLVLDNSGNPADILYIISGGATGATSASTQSVTLSTGAQPSLSVIVH
jgi:large repetitive protein